MISLRRLRMLAGRLDKEAGRAEASLARGNASDRAIGEGQGYALAMRRIATKIRALRPRK